MAGKGQGGAVCHELTRREGAGRAKADGRAPEAGDLAFLPKKSGFCGLIPVANKKSSSYTNAQTIREFSNRLLSFSLTCSLTFYLMMTPVRLVV
jgi:hypothetical protein